MSIRLSYREAAIRVCVDRAEKDHLSGRLFSQRLSAPISFHDISDFMIQVDALLDAQSYPQSFSQIRSFTEKAEPDIPAARSKEELSDPQSVDAAHGAYTTFSLQIRSRQNTTWQGDVDWLDGSPREHFNSILTLVKLIGIHLGL